MRRVESSAANIEAQSELRYSVEAYIPEIGHVSQLLAVGRPITFGTEGNYKTWAAHGWSQDKDQQDTTWMDGHVASLEFMMQPPAIDLLLVARMTPFAINESKQQQLELFLNGLFVDFWIPREREFREQSTPLRKSFFSKESANLLTLVAPNAVSPAETGLGPDQRTLGFAFMQITLCDPTRMGRSR
jgi:hypothetical protein